MRLTINNHEYDVDLEPLKERLLVGVASLIEGADGNATHSMLRQIVKQACNIAVPMLHIDKPDRNADPIKLVAARVVDIVFDQVKDGGLSLAGRELVPFEPEPNEEARQHADTGDGGGQVGDTRSDG